MNRWVGFSLLLVTLGALALRMPQMGARPMHNDEAVNAIKLQALWEQGIYRYDPHEYHGPVLYYATLPSLWLSGAKDFAHVGEGTLRLVPVLFGVAMVLLLWLMVEGLGRAGTIFAGVLTAISPAMVFYSRYFIHEMLLVCFTMLLLAAGWRYTRTKHAGWAALAGAAAGLMYATKETFVIPLAAMAGAVVMSQAWRAWFHRGADPQTPRTPISDPLDTPSRSEPGRLRIGETALCGRAAAESDRDRSPVAATTNRDCCGRGPAAIREMLKDWKSALREWCCWKHLLVAGLAAAAVFVVFFSSFFTNRAGLLDAVRTYLPWLNRAGGASPHIYPWHFYFERLLWFHQGRGPVWSEALILVLAAVGLVAALRGKGLAGVSVAWARFLAFYALLLTAAYSLIPYKTPWCLLGFLHPMILLAGVGATVLLSWRTWRGLQALVGAGLALGAGHLVWEAWQTSFVEPADRRNPYVFAHTSPDLLEMVEKIQALAQVHPDGDRMLLKVMVPRGDYWPLPWYLRQFRQVGWWDSLPPDPLAPVMIVGARLAVDIEEKAAHSHVMTGIFSLRSRDFRAFLELCVESGLWKKYLEQRTKGQKPEGGG